MLQKCDVNYLDESSINIVRILDMFCSNRTFVQICVFSRFCKELFPLRRIKLYSFKILIIMFLTSVAIWTWLKHQMKKNHKTFTSCYNIQLIGKYLYMLFSLNFGLFRVLRFLPTNKTDRQDITEMLKVALSTINQPLNLVLNGAFALLKGK